MKLNAFLFCLFAKLVFCLEDNYVESAASVRNGTLLGRPADESGIRAFLGIPYAAPPVGHLRWRSPQPAASFNGTYNATVFGASCMSALSTGPIPDRMSEDCLTLNVWAPPSEANEARPVMVWLHGGGFQFGGSNLPAYDGTNLAREGVIVVSINYRLGVFGFLSVEEVNADAEATPFANFGLLDQIQALMWIQENIAAFGGDRAKVTVFGQSAGAHAIGLLLTSPWANGLFSKAIIQSGAFWDSEHGSAQTRSEARRRTSKLKNVFGSTSIAELRNVEATVLNNATLWDPRTDPGITAFGPTMDGLVIPMAPARAFLAGRVNNISLLAGFNAAEESFFLSRAPPHSSLSVYYESIGNLFDDKQRPALALYPGNNKSTATQSSSALIGDLVIRQQTWEALDSASRCSRNAVWAYHFTYTSNFSPVAAHTAEVGFVFGNLQPNPTLGQTQPPNRADFTLSRQMMIYWTNFAKHGDPNGPNVPLWPRYLGSSKNSLELGKTVTAIGAPNVERYQFIKGLRRDGALPKSWRAGFTSR